MIQGAEAVLVDGVADAQVTVTDRGLQYGDGLFETLTCVAGRPRWFERHFARLLRGCERLQIVPPDAAQLHAEIECLAAEGARCIVKLVLTRGAARSRGYRPQGDERPTRILSRHAWPDTPHSLRAAWSNVTLGENPWLAGIKHLNRLEQVLAQQQRPAGVDEVLMQSQSGALICGSMSNVFLFEAQRIVTPSLQLCGVAGIMRELVLQAAHALGLAIEIGTVSRAQIVQCPVVYLTNVRLGLRPLLELDGRGLTTDARAAKLQEWINASAS